MKQIKITVFIGSGITVYLTTIQRARVGYEIIGRERAYSSQFNDFATSYIKKTLFEMKSPDFLSDFILKHFLGTFCR